MDVAGDVLAKLGRHPEVLPAKRRAERHVQELRDDGGKTNRDPDTPRVRRETLPRLIGENAQPLQLAACNGNARRHSCTVHGIGPIAHLTVWCLRHFVAFGCGDHARIIAPGLLLRHRGRSPWGRGARGRDDPPTTTTRRGIPN
jgi:hypothetical protein